MITVHPDKITLTVGLSDTALNFDLYEASVDDRKTELQILILRMADDIMNLTDKLKGIINTMFTLSRFCNLKCLARYTISSDHTKE